MNFSVLGALISVCIYSILLKGCVVFGEELELGDLVRVAAVPQLVLRRMQEGHGDYNDDMAQDIDKIGEVTKIRRDGDVAIKFEGSSKSWIMNPKVLSKRGVFQVEKSLLQEDDNDSAISDQYLFSNVHLPEPRSLQSDILKQFDGFDDAEKKLPGVLKETDQDSSRYNDENLYETAEDDENKENGNERNKYEKEESGDIDEKDSKENNDKEINDNKEEHEDENEESDDNYEKVAKEKYDKEVKDDKEKHKDEMEESGENYENDTKEKDDKEVKYEKEEHKDEKEESDDKDENDTKEKDDKELKHDKQEKKYENENVNNDNKNEKKNEKENEMGEDIDLNKMDKKETNDKEKLKNEPKDDSKKKDKKENNKENNIKKDNIEKKIDEKDKSEKNVKENDEEKTSKTNHTDKRETEDNQQEKNNKEKELSRETVEEVSEYAKKDKIMKNNKNKTYKINDNKENTRNKSKLPDSLESQSLTGEEGLKKKLLKENMKFQNKKREKVCSSSQFQCKNGECISKSMRCNGHIDCPDDMSDEMMCSKCQEDAFYCGGGDCIPKTWMCDGKEDCENGRDESDCNNQGNYVETKSSCGPAEWECHSYPKNRCILSSKRCNGDMDCDDGSDEVNCPVCHGKSFNCDNGECIPYSWHCDGEKDCGNGHDEKNCQKSMSRGSLEGCLAPGSSCANNGTCRTRCKKAECDNGICAGGDCKCCIRTTPIENEEPIDFTQEDKSLMNCALSKEEASGASAFINLVKKGKCNRKCINLLMERGGEVDAKVKGKTALWYAINHCQYCKRGTCAYILMEKGADIVDAFYGPERSYVKICEACFNILPLSIKEEIFTHKTDPKKRREGCKIDGKLYKNSESWEKNCCLYTCSNGRLVQMNADSDKCLKANKRCGCCQDQ